MGALDSQDRTGAAPPHRRALDRAVIAAVAAFGVASLARLWLLDSLPGEWYGDISTVWEYARSAQDGNFPADLYSLGVGPLYPISLLPFLVCFGTSYLVVKLVAVAWSLAALALLYRWSHQLLGRWFAALATLVAGSGCWMLVYSRLGDVEAAAPCLAIAPVALADHVARTRPARMWPAALCGLAAGACVYLYGAVFAVPIVTTVAMVTWSVRRPPRGLPRHHLRAYLAGLGLSLLPAGIAAARSAAAFREGHFATRMVQGPNWLDTLWANLRLTAGAYVTRGDVNDRANPLELPHIDRLGLVLAVAGVAFWLWPGRCRRGALVVGGFLSMHVPVLLVSDAIDPSAARSIAAAPFLYLLVAGGIWGTVVLLRRWGSPPAIGATVAVLLAVAFATIELHRYFVTYRRHLPYDNVPIARYITDLADSLPPDTAIYLIGSTWGPGFMPEPKSIRYTMRRPELFGEEMVPQFDCARLAELARPAVLIWSYRSVLPSPGVGPCANDLEIELVSTSDGHRLFHTALLRPAAAPPR